MEINTLKIFNITKLLEDISNNEKTHKAYNDFIKKNRDKSLLDITSISILSENLNNKNYTDTIITLSSFLGKIWNLTEIYFSDSNLSKKEFLINLVEKNLF